MEKGASERTSNNEEVDEGNESCVEKAEVIEIEDDVKPALSRKERRLAFSMAGKEAKAAKNRQRAEKRLSSDHQSDTQNTPSKEKVRKKLNDITVNQENFTKNNHTIVSIVEKDDTQDKMTVEEKDKEDAEEQTKVVDIDVENSCEDFKTAKETESQSDATTVKRKTRRKIINLSKTKIWKSKKTCDLDSSSLYFIRLSMPNGKVITRVKMMKLFRGSSTIHIFQKTFRTFALVGYQSQNSGLHDYKNVAKKIFSLERRARINFLTLDDISYEERSVVCKEFANKRVVSKEFEGRKHLTNLLRVDHLDSGLTEEMLHEHFKDARKIQMWRNLEQARAFVFYDSYLEAKEYLKESSKGQKLINDEMTIPKRELPFTLTHQPNPVSRTLLVKGISPETSKDALRMLFPGASNVNIIETSKDVCGTVEYDTRWNAAVARKKMNGQKINECVMDIFFLSIDENM